MKRQKVKIQKREKLFSYQGRRPQVGLTRIAAAVVCVAAGLVLTLVRIWGMRFSGYLLLGVSAVLVISVFLDRMENSGKGWRLARQVFYVCLAVGLVLLVSMETYVISQGGGSSTSTLSSDAMIVLGAGVNGRTPSLSLRTRLDAALDYLETHPDIPVVLTGGQGFGEEITEAQCMYDWLTAHGVHEEQLLLEEQAKNTVENFAFSYPLLKEQGVDPEMDCVAVVTNDFHIARARLLARKKGYHTVQGVPAKLPWIHLTVNYYLRESFAVIKSAIFD